jgi:glutamate carboxypeptidase
MKGGLLEGILAVEALRSTGTPFGRVTFILNPDEEIGSPSSRRDVMEHARGADAVFVLEAARENGAVVTARKGVTNVHLRFEGRAAHAGVEPEKGRSAILEAAHKTIASRRSTGNGTARRSTSARATAVAGSTSFPITRRSPSRSAR